LFNCSRMHKADNYSHQSLSIFDDPNHYTFLLRNVTTYVYSSYTFLKIRIFMLAGLYTVVFKQNALSMWPSDVIEHLQYNINTFNTGM